MTGQLKLSVITYEEVQKRIFDFKMSAYKEDKSINTDLLDDIDIYDLDFYEDDGQYIYDLDFQEKCQELIQEVVDSGLDLSHIDEYPNPPTRKPYQWFMDLALWANIQYKSKTDEGYTFWNANPFEIHLQKMAMLASIIPFGEKLKLDGKEKWPEIDTDVERLPSPEQLESIGSSLDKALLNEKITDSSSYDMVGRDVINILDKYLDSSHTSKDEFAKVLSGVLSNSAYQSYGSEPFQKGHALNELLRMTKKHYQDMSSMDIKPVVYHNPNNSWDVWGNQDFESAKKILDENIKAKPSVKTYKP